MCGAFFLLGLSLRAPMVSGLREDIAPKCRISEGTYHTQAGPGGALDLVSRTAHQIEKTEPLGLFLSCSWGGAVVALAARTIRS